MILANREQSISFIRNQIMGLNFGHWEIFKLLITALRDIEKHQPLAKSIFDIQFDGLDPHPMPSSTRQKTTMEKQVSRTVFIFFR